MTQLKQLEIDHPLRQPWTDRHRQILRDLYPHIGTAKVAYTMRRSLKSVYSEASRLGLKKDPAFYNRKLIS